MTTQSFARSTVPSSISKGLKLATLIAGLFGPQWALANQPVCSTSVSPYTQNCSGDGVTWAGGALTVNQGVTVFAATFNSLKIGASSTVNNQGWILNPNAQGNALTFTAGQSTLDNSGTINGNSSGVTVQAGSISLLNNTGTINGTTVGLGVSGSSSIAKITNTGMIKGNSFGIIMSSSQSTIQEIVNSIGGQIYGLTSFGIINSASGTIGTLSNGQGVGNNAGPLTYMGKLPTNYNVIAQNPTNYGQLRVTNGSGTTNFGISALSGTGQAMLANYAGVISGATNAQLGLGIADTTVSKSMLGYTFILNKTTGTTWDMQITSAPGIPSPVTPDQPVITPIPSTPVIVVPSNIVGSTTLSAINQGVNPVFAGGTLVLTSGAPSAQDFQVSAQGGTIATPTGGSATLTGSISGAGALTVNGQGTLVLSGANTYSGGTSVASGTLSVQGASSTGSGDVVVAPGATLMGSGSIAGGVTVGGTIKPGNSPGYLAVGAPVTMQTGSTFQQDISGTLQASMFAPVGAAGYYSFMNVSGGPLVIQPGATLAPTLSNLFSPNEPGYGSATYTPALGDQFRIATADGGIQGRFDTTSQPAELAAGTRFASFYNMFGNNSLDLSVIPVSYQTALAGKNANTQSVAKAFDQIVSINDKNAATTDQETLLYVASAKDAAGIANLAQSLSGEIYGAALAVVPQTSQRTQQSVLNRLGATAPMTGLAMTGANVAASMNAMATAKIDGAPSSSVSSNPEVANNGYAIGTNSFQNGAAWGEVGYQRGSRASDANASGFSSNLYQAVFGVDAYSEDGVKLGVGFSLATTSVNATMGASTVNQNAIFVYGKVPVQSVVIDAMASYGLNNTTTSRDNLTGIGSGFNAKNVSGTDALVSVGVSRPINLIDLGSNAILTPYARITWQSVTQAAFSDGGSIASPGALSVSAYSNNGVRGVVGATLGSNNANPMKEDYTYRVNVGVGADTPSMLNPTLNASLVGINTSIYTANAGSTFVQAGVYGTARISENAYVYLGVSGEARTGSVLASVNGGLNIQF